MLPEFLQLKNLRGELSKLAMMGEARLADKNMSAVSVLRVTEGAKAHLGAALPAVKLYVTSDELAAKSMLEKLNSYAVGSAVYLPHRDDVLVHRGSFSLGCVRERSTALAAFLSGSAETLVVSVDALLQFCPLPKLVKKYTVEFKKGEILSPQEAADRLFFAGYVRQEAIGSVGDFALRGDILDVYAVDGNAYRVDFFDELIEDVKTFDPESMCATGETECVRLAPVSDVIFDGATAESIKKKLERYAEYSSASEIAPLVSEGACSPAAVWAFPFAGEGVATVFSYLDEVSETCGKPGVVIFDEPKVIAEKIGILQKEFAGRLLSLSAAGEIFAEHKQAIVSESEIRRQILTRRKLSFTALNLSNPMFNPTCLIQPKIRPVTKYYLDRSSVRADVNNFVVNGFKVMFCCGNNERAKSVTASLLDEDVFSHFSADGNGEENVLVTPLAIDNGFVYPEYKIAVIGVAECVGKKHGETAVMQKQQFISPKPGDYVVHRVHGVGICEGTTIMKAGDYEREFIILRYRDGDTLYVATDQSDSLQKFVGEEHPKLNKLGGKEFEKEKAKVRTSVRKLAVNLLELYAKREKQKGFKYCEDTVWQKQFEDSFEYEETEDQLKAISDIKRDMESGKIMDRLLVGDVGFGKTEVAFRAMFKTVLEAKQAVLLAPTTILARQHYETLKPRLEQFGIDCALLTRLQGGAENDATVTRLADGTLHIVIATHKVLGKNIRFNDLGLLVLDEEQRFGVDHKEKLKERYPLVNVLTLSATPIPRTLNMALSGIRDISMLETAPKGRLPIQTYVTPYSDTLVVDAINRECARGGQTLILLNDIEGLDIYASHLRPLLGEKVRIVTAHGQMAAGELEKRMSAFYEKEYDVLISTTIIENGIDLPDANTLVVLNAGNFGLSQLYQLRGRVGRRGVLAHAYFTIPETATLAGNAEKRLQALLDNTEIGSGFKVALSDLSIRGAGNLLGAEQHGHIEKVGYEMYIELLNEAVEELRTGQPIHEVREVEMKVDVPAYIREGYVSGRDKLRIYKRIATVSSAAQKEELLKELDDVFGTVEQPLKNLIDIALIKNIAKNFDAAKIVVNRMGAGVNFRSADVFKNEGIIRAAAIFKDEAVLTNTIPPSLVFNVKGTRPEEKLEKLLAFFCAAQD